jgi:hypothetical protein
MVALITAWYLPWLPVAPVPTLDSGWELGVSIACERGLAFGHDVVFTYGPYGCYTLRQYWPGTYIGSLLFVGALGLASAWLLAEAARTVREWVGAFLCLFMLGAAIDMMTVDSLTLALPLALVVHAFSRPKLSPAVVFGLLVMGPLALAKFVLLPLAIFAVVIAAALRDDSPPLTKALEPGLFAVSVALAWSLNGGSWHGFMDYLNNYAEVARAYPQAMAWSGRWNFITLASTASQGLVAALAVLLVALLTRQRWLSVEPTRRRLGYILFFVGLFWITVHLGITRGEFIHLGMLAAVVAATAYLEAGQTSRFAGRLGALAVVATIAWLCLETIRVTRGVYAFLGVVSALASLAALLGGLGLRQHGRRIAFLVLVLAVAMFCPETAKLQGNWGGVFRDRCLSSWQGWKMVLSGQDPRRHLDAQLALARAATPAEYRALGALPGGYDILGFDQYLIVALGSEGWRPRPVFQSYSAYTPHLAELNAAFLSRSDAPRYLLAKAQSLDERLPLMDDALIWRHVREQYRVDRIVGEHVLLVRRDASLPAQTDAPWQTGLALLDWTELPNPGTRDILAFLEVSASWVDRLRSLLWKPPIRYLEVRSDAQGPVRSFRIVPDAARAGFILFPLIDSTPQLAAWLDGRPSVPVASAAIRVVDEAGRPLPAHITLRSVLP